MQRQHPWMGWHVWAVDALLVWVSFALSYYLRYEVEFLRPLDEVNAASFTPFIPYTAIFTIWVLLAYRGANLYEYRRDRSLVNEGFKIINGATNAAVLVMALSFLLRPLVFSRLMVVQGTVIAIILLILWRVALRGIRLAAYRRGVGVERVLVVGAGETGRHVIRTIVARPDLGYRLVGFVDDDPEIGTRDLGRVPALGALDKTSQIIEREGVDTVIITLPTQAQRKILSLVTEAERRNLRVRLVPDLFQLNMSQIQVETLGGVPLLGARTDIGIDRSGLFIKRAIDLTVALLMLLAALPVMLMTALAIRLESPGPILFHQERVGLNGQRFRMVKFRSMVVNAEQMAESIARRTAEDPEGIKQTLRDSDPRITKVGRFIRRTSIDELPQLWNVLRGEMSMVGPRPALPSEVALYKSWHRQRLMVRPGLTGLWQVSGRSEIPFEEKCLLDIYYIENWSLGLDLQILLQTAPQVLFRRGAY